MSNVRKRNRKLAKKLAARLVAARDPVEAAFLVAAINGGGLPMKPWRLRAKGTAWTAYPNHSQTTPAIPTGLVAKWARHLTAKRKPP